MKLKIIKLDDFGSGIGYIDNKVTFVPKTVIGDIVDVKITLKKKNYNEAKVIKIIEYSKDRINAKCPYFRNCGGCTLQNVTYENTIKYKKEKVINYFHKNKININPIVIANSSPYGYRNKITLKVVDGKIGFYQEKSHSIVKIDKCLLAKDAINEVIPLLDKMNIINGEVVIRCNYNDEILLIIKSNDKLDIKIDELKKKIKLAGIIINDETFYKDNFFYEMIDNILYKVSYDAFFQVNLSIAQKILEIIKDNVYRSDYVLDLYSGVGTLSLNAALNAREVTGVEIVPNAVVNSLFNAKINKINNARFVLNDASILAGTIVLDFNKLIVDPPRSGLSKEVINLILSKKPETLIYVSCDMHTLTRDIKLLEDIYDIKDFYILDMFSYTYHVESISVLERR